MGTVAKTAPKPDSPGVDPDKGISGGAAEESSNGSAEGTSEKAAEVPVVVEEALLAELPVFETFFKTFG